MRNWMQAAVSLLLAAALCGCGAPVPLKEKLIVEGIAVDAAEAGYKATVQAYSPAAEGGSRLFQATGGTVFEALRNIDVQVGKQAYYSDARVILLSEACLQAGLWAALDFFIRSSALPAGVPVAATVGPAADLFAIESEAGDQPAAVVANLLQVNRSGTVCGALYRVGACLQTDAADPALPLLGTVQKQGKRYARPAGILCFKGQTPCTRLSRGEEWAFRWLCGYADDRAYPLTFRGTHYTVTLHRVDRTWHAAWEGDRPAVHIALAVSCDIAEAASAHKVAAAELADFARALEADMARRVTRTLARVFAGRRCDVFDLGRVLRQRQPARFKALADWRQEMPRCRVTCAVTANVARVGQGAVTE